jgi:hypothetical protein
MSRQKYFDAPEIFLFARAAKNNIFLDASCADNVWKYTPICFPEFLDIFNYMLQNEFLMDFSMPLSSFFEMGHCPASASM